MVLFWESSLVDNGLGSKYDNNTFHYIKVNDFLSFFPVINFPYHYLPEAY